MPRVRIFWLAISLIVLACQSVALPRIPVLTGSTGAVPATPPENPDSTQPVTEALTQIPLHVGHGVRGAWYEIYFTDPAAPDSKELSGGVDGPLVAAIDGARLSVHVAVFSLTLNDVRAALVRAHRRGIDVRVVMESDNMDGEDPQALKEAGVPLLGDRRQGLMHDKFMVIDGTDVWTGSMNFTYSGAYKDNNNLIHIHSTELAQDYEAQFNDMFVGDHFGPDVGEATLNPQVRVDGTLIDVYFTPRDRVQSALVDLVDGARSSIYFLAYSFTADLLGQAIVRAKASGVTVAGVMDADQIQSNLGTEWDPFRIAGVDVRRDANPGQMHDKILIVDGEVAALGSYNFTRSADTTNDENVLVIHNPTIAGAYLDEFRRVYALTAP